MLCVWVLFYYHTNCSTIAHFYLVDMNSEHIVRINIFSIVFSNYKHGCSSFCLAVSTFILNSIITANCVTPLSTLSLPRSSKYTNYGFNPNKRFRNRYTNISVQNLPFYFSYGDIQYFRFVHISTDNIQTNNEYF